METEERPALWPWVLVLVGAPMIVFLTFAVQSGQCASPAAFSDSLGCATGPTVGWPGAVLLAVACTVLFTLAVIRLILIRLRRPGVL